MLNRLFRRPKITFNFVNHADPEGKRPEEQIHKEKREKLWQNNGTEITTATNSEHDGVAMDYYWQFGLFAQIKTHIKHIHVQLIVTKTKNIPYVAPFTFTNIVPWLFCIYAQSIESKQQTRIFFSPSMFLIMVSYIASLSYLQLTFSHGWAQPNLFPTH